MTVTFANLGIQCVKKKDIEQALKDREEIRVDPFRSKRSDDKFIFLTDYLRSRIEINLFRVYHVSAGFSHRAQPTNIDLNAVRLCFQVFVEGAEKGKFTVPLTPVVSDPIYDKSEESFFFILV